MERNSATLSRRRLLSVVAAGSVTVVAPLPAEPAQSKSQDAKRASRYRESEHVTTFYRVNRYAGGAHADQKN